ncbi:MAG TPA: hypothetical protein VM098_05670, partial [Phycisphaerae bacterium]|nr:hypothetical protein [Phycisphaerae bacterium]
DRRRDPPNIVVEEVTPIDSAIENLTGGVLLRLSAARATEEFLRKLHDVLVRYPGSCQVLIEVQPAAHSQARATIRLDRQWFVRPNRRLADELAGLLGEENLLLRPKPNVPNASDGGANGRRFSRPLTPHAAGPSGQGRP